MIGYSEREVFSANHVSLMQQATIIVDVLPNFEGVRCHELARFVLLAMLPAFMKLAAQATVQDGNFAGVDHSWIRLTNDTILDPYSVARLPMVQLVDVGTPTLLRSMYRVDYTPRGDIKTNLVEEMMRWFQLSPFEYDMEGRLWRKIKI